MNAVGIIAEYNPLHNGHVYHIEESLELAGADAVVVAMSGDYVQRGEPAILDKWERAELAVRNGADVVIEIPAYFCLGNASQFAQAGVSLLESLGCVTHMSFGSESGNCEKLRTAADNIRNAAKTIDARIAELAKEGMSFPSARARAYQELFPDADPLPDCSNDVLALEYVMANRNLDMIAVTRKGAAYNDCACDDIFMSATGIRNALQSGLETGRYVPSDTAAVLSQSRLTYPDRWLDVLRYAVMSMTPEEIDECPSGGEGLGYRVKSCIDDCNSWNELVEKAKSKRYTYTRISRLLVQIILGIDRNDYIDAQPQYIRILALSAKGRRLISQIEKEETNSLPIITNINRQSDSIGKEGLALAGLDIHAADVYNLVTGRDRKNRSDHRMRPFIEE